MYDGRVAVNLINISFVFKPILKRQWAVSVCAIRGRNYSVEKTCTGSKKDTEGSFPLAYKPRQVEQGWYDWWESRQFFTPDTRPLRGKTFSMVLPPPNVTGSLHLGHVLTCTVQDILVRWHRMCGDDVVWVPGLDHAGIATQVLVEQRLWHEQRRSRHDVGRDGFMQHALAWQEHQAADIVQQLRRLGLSLDWSRHFYTLDAKQCEAVTEAFIHLFDANMIYRDCSPVNWSCVLQSAISDIEVVHRPFEKATLVDVPGHSEPVEFGVLTDFAYKLCDAEGEVVVSTTRLETMLGDAAVAVHPHDPRYRHLRGAHVWNPLTNKRLPVIFDECVDVKLGAGAVKITPAHNSVDFEVARRHSLEVTAVIMEDGTLGGNCGQFSGLKRFDARKHVREALTQMDLLRGHNDHAMTVPFCSRSGDVVELLLKPQWFVRCRLMAEEAAAALQDGQLQLEPQHFHKVWYDWLYNIRDWCISRQLWWGHRVPAYWCTRAGGKGEIGVWVAATSMEHARRKAAAQLHLGAEEAQQLCVAQDEDVLDTWFSSALIPFSALGWPHQSSDYKKFYPLSVMETGHDILFFWVARMVMLGLQLTCRLPFERVLLHGILCDAHGRKMSKSLGNVVSPEDVIFGISAQNLQKRNREKLESGLLSRDEFDKATEGQRKLFPNGIPECGADALRFTLASHNLQSTFINFELPECHTNSLFCNKLWQASRYTLLSVERLQLGHTLSLDEQLQLGRYDRWVLSRLAGVVQEVNRSLLASHLHLAAAALKSFVHFDFCDVYVLESRVLRVFVVWRAQEASKLSTKGGGESEGTAPAALAACATLLRCLDTMLRCLSPFMPFLCEELYLRLPLHRTTDTVALAPYPTSDQWEKWRDAVLEEEMHTILEMVSAIRRLKGAHMQAIRRPSVYMVMKEEEGREMLQEHEALMAHLARCDRVLVVEELPLAVHNSNVSSTVTPHCTVHLHYQGQVATVSEQRSNKVEKIRKELDRLLKMTASAGYKEKASPDIQSAHSVKIETLKTELKRIEMLKTER